MGYDLSIEDPEHVFFTTTRTLNSRLWFVNNPKLQQQILAYLAKYQEAYKVILYGFILMGNHYHLLARFPLGNKSSFLRDFNSIIARLTKIHVKNYPGGRLWARRARSQMVPNNDDILNWFLYLSLNPVSSGLVENLSEYNSYNSAFDALSGRERKFKIVDWTTYNNRRRTNKKLSVAECTSEHTLTFFRLPGYEQMSSEQYLSTIMTKLEARRAEVIAKRKADGRGFMGRELLDRIEPGAMPRSTKTSTRASKRPLVLTLCQQTRKICLDIYFSTLAAFRAASKLFRSGNHSVQFPPGTYAPTFLYLPASP